MSESLEDLPARVRIAVQHFWRTRRLQAKRQGAKSGRRDHGTRRAVTGGKQIDGFVDLMASLLEVSGIPHDAIHVGKKAVVLPGWFRPTKEWDLVAVVDDTLLATVEFKSQVGSFGNNFNNRAEEAIGNAADLNCAFREGAFAGSPRPWTGYFMLLEDHPSSNRPVGSGEPHFPVFEEFRGSSYVDRYRILCQKLVRERLYDGACLLVSNAERGAGDGWHREPSEELSFRRFATSLMGHASAFARMRDAR